MTVILVFLLVIFSIVGWWLSHQRLLSKPWLESGPIAAAAGTDRIGLSGPKAGLAIFLAVVGTLFALFISAYFMRMAQSDWRSVPLPRILWLNTSLLVLSSVLLQCALVAARDNDSGTLKLGLVTAGLTAIGFLTGQLIAWQELMASGYVVSSNPANGFLSDHRNARPAHCWGIGGPRPNDRRGLERHADGSAAIAHRPLRTLLALSAFCLVRSPFGAARLGE